MADIRSTFQWHQHYIRLGTLGTNARMPPYKHHKAAQIKDRERQASLVAGKQPKGRCNQALFVRPVQPKLTNKQSLKPPVYSGRPHSLSALQLQLKDYQIGWSEAPQRHLTSLTDSVWCAQMSPLVYLSYAHFHLATQKKVLVFNFCVSVREALDHSRMRSVMQTKQHLS